jgi:oligosaccharide translocation protein RFT1
MVKLGDARMGKILASSATGTSFLIMIQLASRIFTFASNQLILRTLSPVVLGIAAQLELFQVSILYFSRESIRMAIQRQPISPASEQPSDETDDATKETQSVSSQAVVNVSYLGLVLGVPASLMFTMMYQRLAPGEASKTAFFNYSVMITGAASLLELSIEPFFAIVQQHMLYEKRAAVEMPAAFLRSAVTSSVFIYASQVNYHLGVLPFALGHLSYSLALIFGYSWALLKGSKLEGFSFLLVRVKAR